MWGSTSTEYVSLDGESWQVRVSHRSRTVWYATGDFRGKPVTGKGGSEAAAVSDWGRKANYEAKR